jgi:hypothetical protein
VGESDTRLRVAAGEASTGREDAIGSGLADVFSLQRRRSATIAPEDERSFYVDTLAEYQWARDAAGLMPGTIDQLVKPVIELCEYYDTVPLRLQPKQLDRYFAVRGSGRGRPCARRSPRSTGTSRSWSSATRGRSAACSARWSSPRSTRSTGPAIVGTSVCGCRRRRWR